MSTAQPLVYVLLMLLLHSIPSHFEEFPKYPNTHVLFSAEEPSTKFSRRLSEPLVGEDGRIYTCSDNYFYAFESNGSVAWIVHLNHTCNSTSMAPVQGGRGKIYIVAENKVMKINFSSSGTYEPSAVIFFDPTEAQEIIGISVSTLSSSVYINVKNRGLFAYTMHGQLQWSAGPVLYQFGYRQGCRKNSTDCFFTSVPMIDRCEASIYISNSEGELYSLSMRSPHFKWIKDLSSFDKSFSITPGNNGLLYVTMPTRLIVLALNVSTGILMWQGSTGPLKSANIAPVVDSNGWISIGSLDGFLYSFSPTGMLKRISKTATIDAVIQVSPILDCSGYAVYISQTVMEEKMIRSTEEYTYVSANRPKGVTFTLLVPSTGSIYWSETYSGQFTSLLSRSDLHHFVLDERIVLAFLAASRTGSPLTCRSKRQKLASSCSQSRPKQLGIDTGNERAILLFLLLESVILIVLAAFVRFCCIFWNKKKIQGQSLRIFFDKRRTLRRKKKEVDRTILELKQKAAEEATAADELENLGDLVRRREGIERKLSTTYSLGRDGAASTSKALLPILDLNRRARSFSFQSAKKESVTIFHTLSDTTSGESSSDRETILNSHEENGLEVQMKGNGKGKAPIEVDSSSDEGNFEGEYWRSPLATASNSKRFMNSVFEEQEMMEMKPHNEIEEMSTDNGNDKKMLLKRRRALSFSN